MKTTPERAIIISITGIPRLNVSPVLTLSSVPVVSVVIIVAVEISSSSFTVFSVLLSPVLSDES